MPSNPLTHALGIALLTAAGAAEPPSTAEPTPIRSRRMELHYRLLEAGEGARVRLWYTRDRGATWQAYDAVAAPANPLVFVAPATGLYGITLTLDRFDSGSPPVPPAPNSPPQRWLFVDDTPPLAQWDGVEAGDDFAARRRLQLRWTAYDDHLSARPVALAFQSSPDGTWRAIESALPNTGRFDWTVPADISGPLRLKLTVADQGGHVVERVHGPVPVERWLKAPVAGTRPAPTATTRPARDLVGPVDTATQPSAVDMDRRLRAQNLLRQGEFHTGRGEYAVAVERFREALEADPELLAAEANLAGVYHLQEDYARALELYKQVLAKDGRNTSALRGAALAYVATKQYPESRDLLRRLLAVDGQDAQACFDLGDVLFLMGQTPEARAQWSRATVVDPAAEAVINKAKRRLETYGVTPKGDGG